jgi:creatinine amidohydrolase
MSHVWVSDLTWQEYKRRVATSLLVLPVGAVHAHGPHLPLNTDTLIAEYLADRIAGRSNALVLPQVHYGVRSDPIRLGGEFPGNMDVGAATFIDYIADIMTTAYRDGARSFLILSSTYSNGPFVKASMQRFIDSAPGARVMIASWWDVVTEETRNAIAAESGVPRSEDHHAGLVETSLVMYAAPGAVRMDLLGDDTSARRTRYAVLPMPAELATQTGTVFRARLATPEIGRRVMEEVVEGLMDGVRIEFPHLAPPK